jgi:hypothetical protein
MALQPSEEIGAGATRQESCAIDRFCVSCRHSLRGLVSRACPECGREFNPDDPRTYSRHARHEGWRSLASVSRFLVVAFGGLTLVALVASATGLGRSLLWHLLIVAPFVGAGLVILLGSLLLPAVPISRRVRVLGLCTLPLLFSIAWTNWPLRVTFALSRSCFYRVAETIEQGGTVRLPQWVGPFRVREIRTISNGNIGFRLSRHPGEGPHLVRAKPRATPVWYNCTVAPLGGSWYLVHEE